MIWIGSTKIMNVIVSCKLERDTCGEPQTALAQLSVGRSWEDC